MGSMFSRTGATKSRDLPMPASPAPELSTEELELAIKYAHFASAAYCDTDEQVCKELAPYKDGRLSKCDIRRAVHTGTLWQFAGMKAETDTEVLAVRVPGDPGKEDEMVVAFRGTETSGAGSLSDILTDAFALQSHIGKMEGMPADKYPANIKVHRGFLGSFNDVVQPTGTGTHDALRSIRDELFGLGVKPSRVVVCGHSLGAALATLGAFWVKQASPQTEVWCYAFASPRVGNEEFSKLFGTMLDKCYRFAHKNDVVCGVPASSMWKHVQKSVLLMEPKKSTYGFNVAPAPAGSTYRAVLVDRPRSLKSTSAADHSMSLYLKALNDVMKYRAAEATAVAAGAATAAV